MNTTQLKYFLSIARHLNFTEAAKEFYITQPAISHQIAELEKELGTRLFRRSTRSVTLTRSGEVFLEDAKRFLDLEESSKKRMQMMAATSEMELKIAYLPGPCKPFLPELVYQFCTRYPQVKVTLSRQFAHELSVSMSENTYDIFFSMAGDLRQQNPYTVRDLFSDPFSLLVRADHPCLLAARVDYEKLATEPFFLFEPTRSPLLAKDILRACGELNFIPRITQNYNTMEEILFSVESGLGISILPYKIKDYMTTNLAYIPLTQLSFGSTVGVSWLESTDNEAVFWFLQMLNERKEERPDLF